MKQPSFRSPGASCLALRVRCSSTGHSPSQSNRVGLAFARPTRRLSQSHLLDHRDPVVFARLARGHVGDQQKHLVAKAADVRDVFTLGRLSRSVRLDVDADHPSLRVSRLERSPLLHRFRRATAELAVLR